MPPATKYFKSAHADIFAGLSKGRRTPAEAVAWVRAQEQDRGLSTPTIYVSTSITSGGYKRDTSLPDLNAIIQANNQAAGLLLGALVGSPGLVTAYDVMMPTEIGKVTLPDGRPWGDTDYLIFYFSYAAGLNGDAAAELAAAVAVSPLATIVADANRRGEPNETRWPSYRLFVGYALGQISSLVRQPGARTHDPFGVLLQLVDVDLSLGCQAETMYASHFGLDILVPGINPTALAQDDSLRLELLALSDLGAVVGVEASPVMPVPYALNATGVPPRFGR